MCGTAQKCALSPTASRHLHLLNSKKVDVFHQRKRAVRICVTNQMFSCFHPDFFDEFSPPKVGGLRCKLSLKCCHSVFRTIRNVSHLELSFEQSVDFTLAFSLHCRFGVVKTYRLFYEDTEIYQVVNCTRLLHKTQY